MPRVPDPYVWLVWACAFAAAWALIYAGFPRLRHALWWVAVGTAPFGLTEPLFAGIYWNPPSLFHLAQTTRFDIESFLFCFGIGGVAAVLYNVVTARPLRIPIKTWAQARHQQKYVLALLCPVILYPMFVIATNRPLWAGIIAMAGGVITRLLLFADLRVKTCAGGVLFLGYYLLFLLLLSALSPGYIGRVWEHGIPGGTTFGLPRAELLFALSFGMLWSGVYEQFRWTFAAPDPRTWCWPAHRPNRPARFSPFRRQTVRR